MSSRVRRWAARRAGTAKPPSASAYWRSSRSNVLARPGVRELSRSRAWHTQITRLWLRVCTPESAVQDVRIAGSSHRLVAWSGT